MASCLIFCAGAFQGLVNPVLKGDYIIAADGGYAHVQALGLKPDCVLGDFDSLGYVPEGAKVFPVEKDDTDTMLAVRHGLSLGYRHFVIYGGLEGPRMDHTVANIQTLLYLEDRKAVGFLVGTEQVATTLRNDCFFFHPVEEGTVSLFAVGGEAKGVTIEGLKYTMENGTLSPGFPLGVSNSFTGEPAAVTVTDGTLLMIYSKNAGIGGCWELN